MHMLLIILSILFTIVNSKLAYVATVFRHGARYPLSNIYDGNATKQFHGKLTTVGMRQQFLLGGYLKAQYIDKAKLINATLFPKQVQVFVEASSQRCVESAISHLVGLFPFGSGSRLPDNIDSKYLEPPFKQTEEQLRKSSLQVGAAEFALKMGFQPVPFINATRFFPDCPNQKKLIAKRIEAQAVKFAQFQLINAPFTQKMRQVFKLQAEYANLLGLAELYDVVICDLNLGRGMPAQFTDYDYKQLKYIQNYLFAFLYGGNMSKIFSTSVVAGILANMDNIVKNGNKEVKRFSVFSGHDTNVVPLLTFFNLTTPECISKKWKNQTVAGNCAEVPPFASNLIFQLHQNDTDTSKHYVKLRYNGDYYNICEKQTKQCDYTQFAARTRGQFIDVAKQCGIVSTESQKIQKGPYILIQ